EAIAKGDLLDRAEIRVAGLRNRAEVERQAPPARTEPERDTTDVAQWVRVVADTAGELVEVGELEPAVGGAEIVGDERLVEVRRDGHAEVLGGGRRPCRSGLDVAGQRARLVFAQEGDARAQILNVDAEVQVS